MITNFELKFIITNFRLWCYIQYLRLRYKPIFHKDHTFTMYDRLKRKYIKTEAKGVWI